MKALLDALLGAVLAAAVWAGLEWSQGHWHRAVTGLPDGAGAAVAMVGLLAAGVALGVLVRVGPALSLWVAAGLLLAVLAPVAMGFGSWWPEALPGSDLQLGVQPGTHLALGFVLAAAAGKTWSRRRARVPGDATRDPARA